MPTTLTGSKREKAAMTRALDTPMFRCVAVCTGLLLELPETLRIPACRMIADQIGRAHENGDDPELPHDVNPVLGRLHDGTARSTGE